MTITTQELQEIAQIPLLRSDIALLAKAIHELYEKARERGTDYASRLGCIEERLAHIEAYMHRTAETWQKTYETAQEIKKSRTAKRAARTVAKSIAEGRK